MKQRRFSILETQLREISSSLAISRYVIEFLEVVDTNRRQERGRLLFVPHRADVDDKPVTDI